MLTLITILLNAGAAPSEFDAGQAFDTLRQNVPLIGFLWFVCIGLILALGKLWAVYQTSIKDRLADKDKHAEEISKIIKENNDRFDKQIKERIEAEEEFRKELNNFKQR